MNIMEITKFPWFSKLLLFAGGVVTSELIRQLIVKWKRLKSLSEQTLVHDVIFFPDEQIACNDFFESVVGCPRQRCNFSHETTRLRKFLSYIKLARKSIDICVYCISCHEIVDTVLKRHKVGVKIRVITDLTMEEAVGAQSYRFMKDGITVRMKKSPFLMHHKFVIIDNDIVAFGSFNWTSQAVTGNFESVLVTNNPLTVEPFCQEYEKLWTEMKAD